MVARRPNRSDDERQKLYVCNRKRVERCLKKEGGSRMKSNKVRV
jgi:hypothetical protein